MAAPGKHPHLTRSGLLMESIGDVTGAELQPSVAFLSLVARMARLCASSSSFPNLWVCHSSICETVSGRLGAFTRRGHILTELRFFQCGASLLLLKEINVLLVTGPSIQDSMFTCFGSTVHFTREPHVCGVVVARLEGSCSVNHGMTNGEAVVL